MSHLVTERENKWVSEPRKEWICDTLVTACRGSVHWLSLSSVVTRGLLKFCWPMVLLWSTQMTMSVASFTSSWLLLLSLLLLLLVVINIVVCMLSWPAAAMHTIMHQGSLIMPCLFLSMCIHVPCQAVTWSSVWQSHTSSCTSSLVLYLMTFC